MTKKGKLTKIFAAPS